MTSRDGHGGPTPRVALSTSSCYPESATAAFEIAARLGYDGVEVMVMGDAVSQDQSALARLAEHYRLPILAVHAPTLLISQRVWSPDPAERLRRAVEMADALALGWSLLTHRSAGSASTPGTS